MASNLGIIEWVTDTITLGSLFQNYSHKEKHKQILDDAVLRQIIQARLKYFRNNGITSGKVENRKFHIYHEV